MNVRIIGKRGSKAKLAITKTAGVSLYRGQRDTDLVVNYGLVPKKLNVFYRKWPTLRRLPMLNRHIGCSKYKAIKDAERVGVTVPDTCMQLPFGFNKKNWIEKRMHSSQGIGIREARGRKLPNGKYFQRFISDRRFELRVHAFSWAKPEDWVLHKRVGPADQIAWNFHQGGHFQLVRYPNKYQVFLEAKEIATKILEIRNMQFGAVDLIVDNNMKVYFIEINSSPGFTEYSEHVYTNAMSALKSLSKREVRNLVR